jgi:hypothetical protein
VISQPDSSGTGGTVSPRDLITNFRKILKFDLEVNVTQFRPFLARLFEVYYCSGP